MLMSIVYNIIRKGSILDDCGVDLQGSLYRVDFTFQIP